MSESGTTISEHEGKLGVWAQGDCVFFEVENAAHACVQYRQAMALSEIAINTSPSAVDGLRVKNLLARIAHLTGVVAAEESYTDIAIRRAIVAEDQAFPRLVEDLNNARRERDRLQGRTLDTFQRIVGEWAESVFTRATPKTIIAHLLRETKELDAAVHLGPPDNEEEEAADCLLLLLHLAHRRGFSLFDVAARKLEENKVQDAGKGSRKA